METQGGTVTDPKAQLNPRRNPQKKPGRAGPLLAPSRFSWLSFPRKKNRGASVSGVTKHGRKLNLEKLNQVSTSPFSSSAAKSGGEIGFSHNKNPAGEA